MSLGARIYVCKQSWCNALSAWCLQHCLVYQYALLCTWDNAAQQDANLHSNANLAISMQVCTFAHEFIYFNQAAISCNGGPCLQDMYPACVLCAAPASADAQFACAASLLITSAIQPTAPLYNSLHATLALHNSTTGSMVCGLTPDKQNYWPLLFLQS